MPVGEEADTRHLLSKPAFELRLLIDGPSILSSKAIRAVKGNGEAEEEDAVEVGGKGWEEVAEVSAGEVKVGLPEGGLGQVRGEYVGHRLGKSECQTWQISQFFAPLTSRAKKSNQSKLQISVSVF